MLTFLYFNVVTELTGVNLNSILPEPVHAIFVTNVLGERLVVVVAVYIPAFTSTNADASVALNAAEFKLITVPAGAESNASITLAFVV